MVNAEEYFPLFLVFLSGLGFSIQGLIQKHLSEIGFHDTFVSVIVRGAVQASAMAVSLFVDEDRQNGENNYIVGPNDFTAKIVLLRSVCGFGSIAFAFLAFDNISLGDASVLVMLGPLVAAILSAIFLAEPFLPMEMVATVLTLAGSALVAKPPFLFGGESEHESTPTSIIGVNSTSIGIEPVAIVREGGYEFNSFGVICGLLASVAAGSSFMLLRLLGVQKNVKISFKNICFVQGVVQVGLSVPALFIAGQHMAPLSYSGGEWALMLVGGVAGTLSQLVMTVGMQRVKSAIGSAMRMSDVAFSFVFQALFTLDPLDLFSLAGAVLVLSGITVMVACKPQGSKAGSTGVELARYSQLNNNFNSGGSEATVMLQRVSDTPRPSYPLYDRVKTHMFHAVGAPQPLQPRLDREKARRFRQEYMHLDQSEAGSVRVDGGFDDDEDWCSDGSGGSVQSGWSFDGTLVNAAQNPLRDNRLEQMNDDSCWSQGGLSQIEVTKAEEDDAAFAEEFLRQRQEAETERARMRQEAYRANVAALVDNTTYFNTLVSSHVRSAASSAASAVASAGISVGAGVSAFASGMSGRSQSQTHNQSFGSDNVPMFSPLPVPNTPDTWQPEPEMATHDLLDPDPMSVAPPPVPPPAVSAPAPVPTNTPQVAPAVAAPPAILLVPMASTPPVDLLDLEGRASSGDFGSPRSSHSEGEGDAFGESMAFYSCNNTTDAFAALQSSMRDMGNS